MGTRKNLVIDIGNSRVKAGLFSGQSECRASLYSHISEIRGESVDKIIYSNVSNQSIETLYRNFDADVLIEFTRNTPLPITLNYDTVETLGLDRIAGVVGAHTLFPERNVLTIDLGSCITFDLIDATGAFQGGIISPGFRMRLRAMNEFTGHLPDLTDEWEEYKINQIGKSTKECMIKGALEGVTYELMSQIAAFQKDWQDLTIIMTGGDAVIFESRLKAPIFVRPHLVLEGLNRILEYNDH